MAPDYFGAFAHIDLRRDDLGVLEVRLHTDGGPFRFCAQAHCEFAQACYDISRDRDNRVVILTGTGEAWCSEFDRTPSAGPDPALDAPGRWDAHFWEGRKILQNLLDIDAPVIAAVNGPALIHSEWLLTCDIVLASETAAFQDLPHLNNGVSPTDGVHVLWTHALGPGRGRYFLLTQERLEARQALALGVCQEVLPAGELMARARTLARRLAAQPQLSLRYARVGMTQRLKSLVLNELALGLAMESVSALAKPPDWTAPQT